MKTLIIDNHSNHLSEIKYIFPDSIVVSHDELPNFQNLDACNLVIISGGSNVPTALRHPDYYAVEEKLIRTSPVPIIGICLGAEIIVTAFGGELKEIIHHQGEIKLEISDDSLEQELHTKTVNVYEAHGIGIKELPKEFVPCAHSDHGIEIFKHISKPIIGIQFHPEVGKHDEIWNWILQELSLK